MSVSPDREEGLLLELLEGRTPAGPSSEEDLASERSLADTLALLAQSLEPIPPSPSAKERLLTAIRESTPRFSPGSGPRAKHPVGRSVVPSSGSPWPLALAAALALCAIGAALFFYRDTVQLQTALAHRAGEVERLTKSEEESKLQVARLTREVRELSDRFNLVIQAGAIACPLMPKGKQQAQLAAARGVLYIAGDHQHWFLKVSGLPELPAGQVYHFWFLTGSGPQSAGTFRTVSNANAELGSPSMPMDVLAVALTVEPAGGSSSAPTGDQILFGHEKVQLL